MTPVGNCSMRKVSNGRCNCIEVHPHSYLICPHFYQLISHLFGCHNSTEDCKLVLHLWQFPFQAFLKCLSSGESPPSPPSQTLFGSGRVQFGGLSVVWMQRHNQPGWPSYKQIARIKITSHPDLMHSWVFHCSALVPNEPSAVGGFEMQQHKLEEKSWKRGRLGPSWRNGQMKED